MRWSAIVLVASLLAAGCGKAVVPAGPDPDAGDDGGTEQDAAPEPDADDPDSGPDVIQATIHAFSRAYTNEAGVPVQNGTITARFGDTEVADCAIDLTEGDCSLLSCRPSAPVTPPDAGEIGVYVDSNILISLAPATDGTYPPYEKTDATLFASGALLSASTEGAEVPAFDVEVTTPTSIAFDGNVPSGVTSVDVSVAGPYGIRWPPGPASETLRVGMFAPPDKDGLQQVIDCRVATSTADLIVPTAILASMPLGSVTFEARVESEATVTTGNYEITLAGAVVAIDGPTGNWARGQVNLIP